MTRVSTILQIRDGVIANKAAIRKLFDALQDGKYLVEINQHNKRSNPQNNYYWQMLTIYVQPALYDHGWQEIKTKEDAHEFVSKMFLKAKMINEQTGEETSRIKSTTELSKTDFNAYLEEIWQWAAEYLSINIPSPNQQLEIYVSS